MTKLANNARRVRMRVAFEPRKYPKDIKPKNVPIIILDTTADEPTKNPNWRMTSNSKDKLTYPFKNIKNNNQVRNLKNIVFSLFFDYKNKLKKLQATRFLIF
jgi:hypothetical protein